MGAPLAAAGGLGGLAANRLNGLIGGVRTAVREDPVLVAAGILVALLLLTIAAIGLRLYLRPAGRRFVMVLEDLDAVTVLMHPNPDPDAMSCALAVKELADATDTEATLQYAGEIRHQENRAFETVLNGAFRPIESASDLASEAVILVDHNEPRGFSGADGVRPVAVIDHHPGDGEGTEFTDVRTGNGSCASIFAEYFEDLNWQPVDPEAETIPEGDRLLPPRIATGLLYGIQSDTKQLTKGCSNADFDAAEYLYPGVDADLLDRIANPEVDAEVLDVKATAIANREVRNAFAVSDVGTVSNADAIPQAADELLRLEGITAVVVLGDKDGEIHLSGRSRDDRVHMGKTLSAVVDEVPMGGAGGHARMGGGQLSIEHMQGLGPGDGMSRAEFRNRLFDAMGGDLPG